MTKYYIEIIKDGAVTYLNRQNNLCPKPIYWNNENSAKNVVGMYLRSKAYKRIVETISKITVKESEYTVPIKDIVKKASKMDDRFVSAALNSVTRIKYDPTDDDIDKRMAIATDFIKNVTTYANDQYVMVEKEDQLVLDILHKIEFTKFNACDGYKMAREIKESRIRRRIHKDRFLKLTAFANDIKDVNLTTLEAKKEELSNREYKPRILEEDKEDAENKAGQSV